jgi:biopolymer transport protein ExbB/TolQ
MKRTKKPIQLISSIAPFIGFVGTIAGMSVILPAIARPEPATPHDLFRGVIVAVATTLALLLFVLVPVVVWTHHRQR